MVEGPFEDVEAELMLHPGVAECAITRIDVQGRKVVVAFVVPRGEGLRPPEMRAFLTRPRSDARRTPRALVPVQEIPRDAGGRIEYGALPLPALVSGRTGKSGGSPDPRYWDGRPENFTFRMVVTALPVAVAAFLLTDTFWHRSTDLSGVPQPWAALFLGLYLCECLAFGLGAGVLAWCWPTLFAQGRSRALTVLTGLSVAWLLAAWWPQDNLYRLAAKDDWPRQAALVTTFNLTLMLAGLIVALYVAARPKDP